ncbi:MAG TPA: hypothetical protein VJP87_08980 [Candidatus Acidoferrales bacterium]|nr:hypothetical protein [Candidatus Acidoferrales bacterium]
MLLSRRPRPRGIGALLAAVLFAITPGSPIRAQGIGTRLPAKLPILLFRSPLLMPSCLPLAGAIGDSGNATEGDERLGPCLIVRGDAEPKRVICHSTNEGYACADAETEVRTNLLALGKKGETVLEAREGVRQILSEENACSAWFRDKDPNAAETFETLRFAVDKKSVDYVAETGSPDLRIYSNPYVATVLQGGGSYQTITLNAGGAFFRRSAYVRNFPAEGGNGRYTGTRFLRVGPYTGNTAEAQITTLLHEFGHVIDLLPMDEGDVDGKSVHNTDIVVAHCKAEITQRAHGGTLSAAH